MSTSSQDDHNVSNDQSQHMVNEAVLKEQPEGECDITRGAQQQLLEIGKHIEKILMCEASYVDSDIHRITGLIQDSMEMLQSSFCQVMEKTQENSTEIVKLINYIKKIDEGMGDKNIVDDDARKKMDDLLNHLSDSSNEIHQEINNSIRALQFEDITRQLTGHIQKRLEHINQIALVAHTDIAGARKESELKEIASRLHSMCADFKEKNIADIVQQQDMSEGDIDLF